MKRLILFALILEFITQTADGQPFGNKRNFTHADTLRGTVTPQRAWWNVLHYDVTVQPDFDTKTIQGKTSIQYRILEDKHTEFMQVDLQMPLVIDSVFYNGNLLKLSGKTFYRD